MKYHIDTIPVWDALRQGGECPLCILENITEKSYIDSSLGASVMEPDTRVKVNKKGFCPLHFEMLFDAQNRLGLALMAHTYLQETKTEFEHISRKLRNDSLKSSSSTTALFFSKGKHNPAAEFTLCIKQHTQECIICERLQNTINRYAYTVLHLWNTDPEFKTILMSSRGFCLPHLATTIDIAKETLPHKKQTQWTDDILPLIINALGLLEEELYWFTQKFDYRNQDKPWGNSKDALSRTIQKLTGRLIV
jgi:hypothetical protein